MFAGSVTLCLKADNLEASRNFWLAMGLDVIDEESGNRIVMQRGMLTIALMPFLDRNLLNFRGADVEAIHQHMKARGLNVKGEPEQYTAEQYQADADGICWSTQDPDGNMILFDTNAEETTEEYRRERLAQALKGFEKELMDLDASDECLNAYREHMLARFLV
ncbi:MAG: VOC family protein [Pseudomonadales bacterium]|nr:VOC family protein [Pseudomonadales bacterium]